MVLDAFVMQSFGLSFTSTVAITIALIWVYTFKGGIKTIVWTDTIQTVCMITAVILTILAIGSNLDLDLSGLWQAIQSEGYTKMFYFEGGWSDPNNFFKQFISGALVAVVMTGLDQDMMQKNLTCKSLGDAQKNVFVFSVILIFANLLFLTLGGLLYVFASKNGIDIPARTDLLYPEIALNHLNPGIGIVFILGLIAAAYSSADSALTSLTTSFCVDFLDFEKSKKSEEEKKRTRIVVHVCFSILLLLVIVGFKAMNNDAIINSLLKAAGYTYGPILGLFLFGIVMKRPIWDKYAIAVCIASPIISFILDYNSAAWFGGLEFGYMILALNGLLTFTGLWLISKK